jgi:hypothetical protein
MPLAENASGFSLLENYGAAVSVTDTHTVKLPQALLTVAHL